MITNLKTSAIETSALPKGPVAVFLAELSLPRAKECHAHSSARYEESAIADLVLNGGLGVIS
jgi:hypothetical protein